MAVAAVAVSTGVFTGERERERAREKERKKGAHVAAESLQGVTLAFGRGEQEVASAVTGSLHAPATRRRQMIFCR
jgi:hypothetical protein